MTTQTLKKWSTSTLGKSIEIIDGDRGKNYPKQDEFLDYRNRQLEQHDNAQVTVPLSPPQLPTQEQEQEE